MTGGMAALLSCLLLFSCNNDDFLDGGATDSGRKHSDNICFSIASPGAVQTKRAAAREGLNGEYSAGQLVLRAADAPDSLCVRTTVSDGIDGASTFAGQAPLTRAMPVDDIADHAGFHVQAHYTKGGAEMQNFYMDDDVTNQTGSVWSTTRTYYWPGEEYGLQFYAWAPADAAWTSTPQAPGQTTLAYTVPTEVDEQKDLVVATTDEIAGNNDAAVPLTFRHICTAVKFQIGSQMQEGTIKSVALKGVRSNGTYDMATDAWALGETTGNFAQTLTFGTTGSEADGTAVTTDPQTFMMLPQTLPGDATVEVVFQDATTGTERTLSASIAGTNWPQGQTVTYRLSVTPEYELEFISEPEVQDAHYIIYPIRIKAVDVPDGSWTMTSDNPDVTLRTDLTILTRRGFWVEEDKGAQSITGTTSGEDITVYAFLAENAGTEARDITLSLRPTNDEDAQPATFTITQLCPSWNGDLGCERFEEYDEGFSGYPWGFLWDEDLKITYDLGNAFEDWEHTGLRAILFFYLALFNDNPWVKDNGLAGAILGYEITFDFGQISSLNVALSDDDGIQNTWETYNFQGLNDASSIMQLLEENGYEADTELPSNPTVFAARTCAMKNKFNKEISEEQGQTVERAVLREENLVWYLPARNEAPQMQDSEYPLSGNYWTSTAIDNNQQAYKYTAGGSTSNEIRTSNLHVRAVRKKPAN